MNPLCKYRDLFGIPNEGIHSIRFMNIAVVDVVQTIIGAYVIHRFTRYNLWLCMVALFLLGIICHRLFCVHTTVDKWLRKFVF